MIVNLGVKHNVIDFMQGYAPGKGDPLQYVKAIRPNTFAAEEQFLKTWQKKEINFTGVEQLHIMIIFDHCGGLPYPEPSQKLARTKKGYSCSIYLGPDDLNNNGFEKTQAEIEICLRQRVEKILHRLDMLRNGHQ